jgi:hypothetical protein
VASGAGATLAISSGAIDVLFLNRLSVSSCISSSLTIGLTVAMSYFPAYRDPAQSDIVKDAQARKEVPGVDLTQRREVRQGA